MSKWKKFGVSLSFHLYLIRLVFEFYPLCWTIDIPNPYLIMVGPFGLYLSWTKDNINYNGLGNVLNKFFKLPSSIPVVTIKGEEK